MVTQMYEELKGKRVKVVYRDGDIAKALRGIFEDYDESMFKIKIGDKINYFDRKDVIRIRLEAEEDGRE